MNFDIKKKFHIYNSLFLNLSYEGATDVGYLIPILASVAEKKLADGMNPIEIFDQFCLDYGDMIGEDKIGFMFKVIQYVERQVVLFDSIEDSISPYALEDQDSVLIDTIAGRSQSKDYYDQFLEHLNQFSVRIVLTAHPTQFYRPPVLDIISNLRKEIKSNQVEKIDLLLHQLGLTSLVNLKSPTPLEEASNIIHICRYAYYDAIGDLVYQLSRKYPEFNNDEIVMLGFWPCGDRDGNPFVTHEVTSEVIDLLRMTLMKCYYQDVKALRSQLTFRNIEDRIVSIQSLIYKAMFNKDVEVDHVWILNVLNEIKEILISKYKGLYLENVERLISKINVFKNHFASLDIRQDSSVHSNCITEILKYNGKIEEELSELSEDELISILTTESLEIPEIWEDRIAQDTVLNIAQLPHLQQRNGERGCHRYIISNSEDIFAVLNVLALFRWIHKSELINFDIIPLFETMKGMSASTDVMQKLYTHPVYCAHLKDRSQKQTIMLGFSDGTKDGGYLKANWSIYRCKEALSILSTEHNISAVFFDGRGGPPARGGGKTFNFYASRGASFSNHDIQLTIQGQTITSTYGTDSKFAFNAEQMVSSGLTSIMAKDHDSFNSTNRSVIEELSQVSYDKYIQLKEHPQFLDYLANMTTLKFYSRTKIGSRPGKRNKSKKLSLSDLRAISYVGSWSQLKQNIPGYYGVGTAIKQFKDAGRIEEVKNLYNEVPFFKTLIDNSMMSLTKCYFELTRYMQHDNTFGSFWDLLHDEFTLSKQMLLEITEMRTLMEGEQRSKHSIKIRDEIVRPLLLVQHYALQMLNNGLDVNNHEIYEKLVVRSLYGNINASRNSA